MNDTPTPRTDHELLYLLDESMNEVEAVPADFTRQLERELAAWQTELSKVMPPDFKDWWQNSKTEWPLVARLVIEAKAENEDAMIDHAARLERELAAEKEEHAETRKDYLCLAELLDGHDATECRANLVRLKGELSAERALADRLAGELDRLAWMAGHEHPNSAEQALALWKEARRDP